MRRTSPSPVPIRRPRPPQPHTFTHMVDSIKTPSMYARRAGGPAQSPHGQPRLVGHLGDTRTQQAEQSTEPMRWTSKKQAAREPSNGSEHHQQGGGGRNRQQKNTTTTATAPHYEAGSCEDGGLRLLPVTHQRAKGTTHTRHAITAARALGKSKQSVENAATTGQGDPPVPHPQRPREREP